MAALALTSIGQSLWDRHDAWWPPFVPIDNRGPVTTIGIMPALMRLRDAGVYGPTNKIVYCVARPRPDLMIAVCTYDDTGYEFQIEVPLSAQAETLRDLIIAGLLKDIRLNRCEFNAALQGSAPPYAYPDDIPLTPQGDVDHARITPEILANRTDKELLAMFDGNACLRYR
jgi:hypothetical protein